VGLEFVDPDVVRLNLTNGSWIEVKRELPFGEAERLRGMAYRVHVNTKDVDSGKVDDVRIDMSAYKIARMVAYIVDWNALDKKGKPIKLTPAALAALKGKSADEVEKALDAHIEAMAVEGSDDSADPTQPETDAVPLSL
jgi:hypothetical protein